jgi:hypothetical protein
MKPFVGPMPSFVNLPPLRGYNKFCSVVATSLPPRFENFDRQPFPNEAFVIANMIAVVQPELDEEERDIIASQISIAIKKYNIEPQIMVAIIDTESNFNAGKISSTGDLSVAQINVEVWNKEFRRMKMPLMDKEKVKRDQEYALSKMAEILSIIKSRNEKNDRRWYARYHSNTIRHKSDYLHKLEIRLKMLANSFELNNQIAQSKNLMILGAVHSSVEHTPQVRMTRFTSELLNLTPMSTPSAFISKEITKETSEIDIFATLISKEGQKASIE